MHVTLVFLNSTNTLRSRITSDENRIYQERGCPIDIADINLTALAYIFEFSGLLVPYHIAHRGLCCPSDVPQCWKADGFGVLFQSMVLVEYDHVLVRVIILVVHALERRQIAPVFARQ